MVSFIDVWMVHGEDPSLPTLKPHMNTYLASHQFCAVLWNGRDRLAPGISPLVSTLSHSQQYEGGCREDGPGILSKWHSQSERERKGDWY